MKLQIARREVLLGGAVGALAVRQPCTAQADTTFANFSFAATGAPTARTMPDRLSDVINVKDWGAVGNNVTPTTPPTFRRPSTSAFAQGGGKVFFPAGQSINVPNGDWS